MLQVVVDCLLARIAGEFRKGKERHSMENRTLVLLRHGESLWNQENRFTGWQDVDLSDKGRAEARSAGQTLKSEGFDFDLAYVSVLKRAQRTLDIVLDELDRMWLPVIKDWRLNERHYGALTGLNKAETAAKHGEEQVKIWRRSFDTPPPPLSENDPRLPEKDRRYMSLNKKVLPRGESLKQTIERLEPLWTQELLPKVSAGERLIVAAHGNSIRGIVKVIEGLTAEQIMEINIPTGVPLVYILNSKGQFVSKRYLGDQEKINTALNTVAAQGKSGGAKN
jgi:2,3-bisphosphoglycerate-dependent phosphoglycerate mutase